MLNAKEVTPSVAQNVAINAFSQIANKLKTELKISESFPVKQGEITLFTILNFEGGGHIIVSNEDLVEPVLGYGLNTNLNIETLNPGLNLLFDRYREEINYVRKNGAKANETISQKWKNFLALETPILKSYSIGSFLIDKNFHQDSPYNNNCPDDPNDSPNKCLVGCNGIALGLILDYWGDYVFPDSTVSHSCWTLGSNVYTVNFYNQDYNWDDISTVQSATSEFLFHCALATKPCPFSSTVTGSTIEKVETAFESYFGFITDCVQNRSSYTSAEWINLLKGDIDNEQPIVYAAGSTINFGHTWVIDGYDSNNLFHCNWGWGDDDDENDFYSLTSLNPEVSDSIYYFNTNFQALTGIHPVLDALSGLEGSNSVCSSNESYSVTIPTLASVVWSKSSNLEPVGGNTGTTYTVNKISTGEGYVTATIKNSQNQTFLTRTKTVWVGEPDPDDFYIVGLDNYGSPIGSGNSFEVCENNYYTFYLYPVYNLPETHHRYGITDTEFYFDFDYDIVAEGYGWAYIYVNSINGSSYGLVDVDACTYESEFMVYNVEEGYCGYSLTFSPNPTNGETTLSIEPVSGEFDFDETVEWEYEVYSPAQSLKEKKTKLKGNTANIQTRGWEEGIYVVRAQYKGKTVSGKLVVKK